MTVKIPEFKRCCFCFPLRPGLLAWGYFKIIADALITPILGYLTFILYLQMLIADALITPILGYLTFILVVPSIFFYRGDRDIELIIYFIILLVALITVIANFVASIIFIVAGHKKSVELIRGFYNYSICELIVTTLLIVAAIGVSIFRLRPDRITTLNLIILAVYLLILIIHAYFILLLRSEVMKLNGRGELSFENNPAEAQYMINSKEKEAVIENV